MKKKEWISLFGDNLKRLIDDKGISRKELANKTYLTEATLSRYINKKQAPSPKAVVNLSIVLGVPIKDLIGFTNHIE